MSIAETAASLRDLAEQSGAWPFEEARKIVARLKKRAQGRSDLRDRLRPLRPAAYRNLRRGRAHHHGAPRVPRASPTTGVKTRLIAFSDDMDGLRKVPDNVPNREMLEQHLGKPLTRVPDPFGTHPSFGEHNNARLRAFLDRFPDSSTISHDLDFECYTSGRFDKALLTVLEHFDKVIDNRVSEACGLSDARRTRRSSRSSPSTGIVPEVPVVAN